MHGDERVFMFGKKVKFSKDEQKFLDILDSMIINLKIFPEEREKLIKAKQLFESGEYFPNVVHRIDITFRYKAMKSELSPAMSEFYVKFPEILRQTLPYGSNPGMFQGLPL